MNHISILIFREDVTNKKVEKVVVEQSTSVPTGTLQVQLNDNTVKSLAVSDVNKSEEYLTENNIPFLVSEIQQRSGFGSCNATVTDCISFPLILLFIIMRRGMSNMQGGGMLGKLCQE